MINEKAERFKRVAAPRVQRVLDSIDNLAKCSNRRNYEFEKADVSKMLRTIKDRVRNLERLYSDEPTTGKSGKFSF